MKNQSNVVKEKNQNGPTVSDGYTKKYGGGKFMAGSTQGTGYDKDKGAKESC